VSSPALRPPPERPLKFVVKLLLALAVGGVCVGLVIKDMDAAATGQALERLPVAAVLLYILTLAITHLFRAWRWEYLLRPIGVRLPFRDLMSISAVGFMAILAMPVRLGEFVRPYLVVRQGKSRMTAILGTVAVERIVDGLLISIIFFTAYAASDRGSYPAFLAGAAWLSLLGFLTLTLFLGFALVRTEWTIRCAVKVTLLERLSPRLAEKVSDKLRSLIRGFRVLGEPRNLIPFLIQSVLYWGSNGLGMWLLARYMGLPISLSAAYATMSFTGVVITLPNSPGLVGQFHLGIKYGLGAYLPAALVNSTGLAYALVLHAIQFLWYVGVGFLALLLVPGGARSLRKVVSESNHIAEEGGAVAGEPSPAGLALAPDAPLARRAAGDAAGASAAAEAAAAEAAAVLGRPSGAR
jgi:uncharacterized protein (TIRG00374 family)